jgi:hypothetical protein
MGSPEQSKPFMLTRIGSIPIADGCTFIDVKGRNFVAQASMDLQNSAFECDCWFNDRSGWERHCQEHLEELLRYDPLVFRNVPVKPGYCCFCLGNTRQSAPKRMEQFVTDRSKWYDHIEGHLTELGRDSSCPHPACCVEFESVQDLRHHLMDVHCYQPPRGRKRRLGSTRHHTPEEGAPGYLPPKLCRMVHEFASFKMASVPGRSWHGVYTSDASAATLATQPTLRHTAPHT